MKINYLLFLLFFRLVAFSQGEANNWYFGQQAGLNFSTNPPTILTNGVMPGFSGGTSAYYSCASISDAAGNLLFYTEGANVWNASHQLMANGTGLTGSGYNPQGVIVVKMPGNANLYYIFHTSYYGNCWNCGNQTFNYSVVDMSLAAGQGSVVVKNSVLNTGYISPRVTATKHCNGIDIWVLGREMNLAPAQNGTVTPMFKAYLLTTTGVTTVAVTSPAATYTYSFNNYWDWGTMKLSPNGKKLAASVYNYNNINNNNGNAAFELFDFDNTTGVVTNSLSLASNTIINNTYHGGFGCEFSPDGTKLYGTRYNNNILNNNQLYQWDLCAGSPTAIAASLFTIVSNPNNINSWGGVLQLASNGKIYCIQLYAFFRNLFNTSIEYTA